MEKTGWKILNKEGVKKLGIEALKLDAGDYLMVDISYIPKGLSIEEYITMIQKHKIVFKCGNKCV